MRERNVRQADDLLANAVGQFLHGRLVEVSGQLHVDHLVAETGFGDDGALGFRRERGDAVHGQLELVDHVRQFHAFFHFDGDDAHALGRLGVDFADAFDGLDGLLDAQDDTGLHLFGRGTQIAHLNIDAVRLELRHRLFLQHDDGDDAAQNDGEHHQVGGHVIGGEPTDQAAYFAILGATPGALLEERLAHAPSSSVGSGPASTTLVAGGSGTLSISGTSGLLMRTAMPGRGCSGGVTV